MLLLNSCDGADGDDRRTAGGPILVVVRTACGGRSRV